MVLSDWIKVKITSEPGSSFIDRMIALVEGAERQKTPNELALSILLSGLTLVFLITVVTLWGLANYSATALSVVVLVALLVTLIPTTIGGLLSAIGIAGMDRLIRFNVIATSGPRGRGGGRRRYAAARQDRHHHLRQPHGDGVFHRPRASTRTAWRRPSLLASLADETPEGRSIVALAKTDYGVKEPDLSACVRQGHPLLGADAPLRHRHRRPLGPQRRRRRHSEARRD